MFENITAIDVGTFSIKVVAVRTGLRDFQVKSFSYENIDLTIDNQYDAVSEALNVISEEEQLKGYKIITNLPMEKEIIRNISFPFSDVEKIADAIPYEAEENIPFKLDDLILDFQSLKSEKENEGRILLAAAHKDSLHDFLGLLGNNGIKPVKMGMESNALFECYRYFNKIEKEAVIQIDIGNNKTIINLIRNNHLLYTRSISIGINLIHHLIADLLKLNYLEAVRSFENLNLDLTSFENNAQRNFYKSLKISRQQLKKIYTASIKIMEDLIEQIILTLKALFLDCGKIEFNRALISGGGSNIIGIGSLLSKALEIPVISLPFLEDYKESRIQTQFPIAFGTILAYINQKRSSINFLKGEFIPDISGESKKIYYISAGFGILAVIILLISFIISAILTTKTNTRYNRTIEDRYKDYFKTRKVPDDPIAGAIKILKKEKKELQEISQVIPEDSSVLDLLKDILSYYPKDSDLDLKNFVFNERIIRFDGSVGSTKNIDSFKESLIKTKKFDSVTLNTTSRKNVIRFRMIIKQKIKKEKKAAGKS